MGSMTPAAGRPTRPRSPPPATRRWRRPPPIPALHAAAPPAPQLIGRDEWGAGALATLGEASAAIEAKLEAGLTAPGPLGGVVRRVAGTAAGVEAGVAVGYAARRVLGQYEVALIGARRRPRLLLVRPNIASARAELEANPATFLRWIALHETTHVLQFQAWPGSKGICAT